MKNLTLTIASRNSDPTALDAVFVTGLEYGRGGGKAASFHNYATIRQRYGFKYDPHAKLLTPPENNAKLDKTEMVVYGLTLQSHVVTLLDGTMVRTCPHSGRCAKVCVLNNGNGAYPTVQRARDARTEYFATTPLEASWQLGYELGKALRKHGTIGFRPNVNQDVDWNALIPSMSRIEGLKVYGYTKRFPVCVHNQVEAYSLNESSVIGAVRSYLDAGINVAAVTNRKKGQPVEQWAHKLGLGAEVVDADENDVWMLDHAGKGVIGDLTAKGKARTLGRSETSSARLTKSGRASTHGFFVQNVY